jgi:uncharacterized protein YprB with RNaseH-like and TPR domain
VKLSLADRLARYQQLVSSIQQQTQEQKESAAIDIGLEGIVRLEFSGGSILCKDTMHPAGEPFGAYAADWGPASCLPAALPPFLAAAAGSRPQDWAFVDCETTGLSGGAGTLAFLVAVGRPVKGGFFIRQFFLSDPADEQGLLEAIEQSLAGVEVLWTYNGKCFDLPLLETRFRFWRMALEWDRFKHVDLLVPTRVLFRRRIGDCSLGNLEEHILKIARLEDLPGSEVPAVYFEYLQTGHSPRLHRVFEHNRVDVLSLAMYAAFLWHVFDPAFPERLCYPEDVLSLARYLYRRRELEQAEVCLADAETFALGRALEVEYHRLRAAVYKRHGQFERACPHYLTLARHPEADSIPALEELAKHHEHRRREYRQALKFTERAIALAERELAFGAGEQAGRDLPGLYHRRARLQHKLHATETPE